MRPCAIELSQYIMDTLTHLNNESVYESLTKAEASPEAGGLYYEIHRWTVIGRKKKAIDDNEVSTSVIIRRRMPVTQRLFLSPLQGS